MTEDKKKELQRHFKFLQIQIAELLAYQAKMEKLPKWVFRFFGDDKYERLFSIRCEIAGYNEALNETRLKLLQHNGNNSTGEVSIESA